ncbi:MAG: HRDC domain-containing protein [Nitriliruptorales bacterium]|nr:HRDC domain-containing protein [Nitriliruptorales bacterium]
MPPAISFVDDRDRLAEALRTVDHPVVGADVERADSDNYYREASLIQVGADGACTLVDPHAIDDLDPLERFLAGRLTVFHAIENDVEPLEAAGIGLHQVADTSVAAAMLGMPTGLSNLLEDVLGIELTSNKSKLQRADWSRRPLTDEMVAYAAEDVVHLPALWHELATRLEERGRTSWYEQELAATLERATENRRAWFRTKGVGRLDPQARAVLRSLWEEREQLAKEHDIAPALVISDKELVTLAEEPADTPTAIGKRGHSRRSRTSEFAQQLFDAQQAGREAPPEEPPEGRRWDTDDRAAYDAMRKARADKADELGMDPGVLCPSRVLWDATLADPDGPEELCEAAGLLPWQTELLADDLWTAYTGASEDTDEG